MSDSNTKSTRRAFFLTGGATLGAGVAAGASALVSAGPHEDELTKLRRQLESAQDREAIRRLHLDFASLVGSQHAEDSMITAYRYTLRDNARALEHAVVLSEDGLQARATFDVEVEVSTPLQGDSTAVQMALLQGNVASRRWEAGRFEARYVKTQHQWKVASLLYSPV
jgi:hypothetical protein